MKEYLNMVKERVSQKFMAKFVQILREENEQADRLSFVQYSPVINKIGVQVFPIGADWMTLIIYYLKNKIMPEEHNASRRLKVQSSHFVLIGDVFYKMGFSRHNGSP